MPAAGTRSATATRATRETRTERTWQAPGRRDRVTRWGEPGSSLRAPESIGSHRHGRGRRISANGANRKSRRARIPDGPARSVATASRSIALGAATEAAGWDGDEPPAGTPAAQPGLRPPRPRRPAPVPAGPDGRGTPRLLLATHHPRSPRRRPRRRVGGRARPGHPAPRAEPGQRGRRPAGAGAGAPSTRVPAVARPGAAVGPLSSTGRPGRPRETGPRPGAG